MCKIFHDCRGLFASTVQLTWLDRRGKKLGVLGQPQMLRSVALSPDGMRAEVITGANGKADASIKDLASGILSTLTPGRRRFSERETLVADSQRITVNRALGGVRVVTVASGRLSERVADIEADDCTGRSPGGGRGVRCGAQPTAQAG